jgi:hypothetical protein
MSIQAFPIYLNSQGFKAPEKGTYYLICKDGAYMRVERAFGSAIVKIGEMPFLQEAPSLFAWTLPKLPACIVRQAKTFFQRVFAEHRSESYLTLLYSRALNQYRLWCPSQTVTYSSVDYDRTDSVPDEEGVANQAGPMWQSVGTIHSHCDFGAFHSGTDTSDEASFDGLHITIGHVDREEFSMVSTIAVCNNRKEVDVLSVVEGVEVAGETVSYQQGEVRGSYYRDKHPRFRLSRVPDRSLSWSGMAGTPTTVGEIVDGWMAKVTKRAFTTYGGISYSSREYTPRSMDDYSHADTRYRQRTLPFSGTVSSSEWEPTDRKPADDATNDIGGGSRFYQFSAKWLTWLKGGSK